MVDGMFHTNQTCAGCRETVLVLVGTETVVGNAVDAVAKFKAADFEKYPWSIGKVVKDGFELLYWPCGEVIFVRGDDNIRLCDEATHPLCLFR